MRVLLVSIAALSLAASSPAIAAQPTSAQSPSSDVANQAITDYFNHLFGLEFGKALAVTDRLQLEESNKQGRAAVQSMRAAALLGLKRDKEARRYITEAQALAPQEPNVFSNWFLGALLADRFEIALESLDVLIDRFPDVAREQSWDLVRIALANEPKGQEKRNEDRRIALGRIGYGGDTELGDSFAAEAINLLMKRGDVAGAGALVRYVDQPRMVENMLILRRFESLWPSLENAAGPQLEKVRASSVAIAEQNYNQAPDNHEKLAEYANALRRAGRLDEAIALRAKLPTTVAAMSKADEQLGWAVNNVALALHEAGRADEADRLFALLNDAPMPEEGWRVSMKINRLELLVHDGKFERALPLVEPTAKVRGSPYAAQLVRRLRYCTLSGLKRAADAAKYLPDMLAHADDAPGPTIDGLLCAGEIDKAEEVAIAALARKDAFGEDFVRQLQRRSLTSDDPSVWQGNWQLLRAKPRVRQAFDRLGRDMPEGLVPPNASQASAQ